jgi:hypothetical protein
MKLPALAGLLVCTLILVTPIASPAGPDSHREAVARLFELTHMQRLIEESVDGVLTLQIAQNPALAAHKEALRGYL